MTQTNDPPLVASVALIPDSDEKADLDAPSDEAGKLVTSQAPNITITSTTVVADQAERLALDVQEGDIAIQSDTAESYIFTGGPNIEINWQLVQFDAVGGISGEDIAPRDIDGRNVVVNDVSTGTLSSGTTLTANDVTINGLLNGADTSEAAAGEALTSDGAGGFGFSPVGSAAITRNGNEIDYVSLNTANLPAANDTQDIALVTENNEYVQDVQFQQAFNVDTATFISSIFANGERPKGIDLSPDGTRLYEVNLDTNLISQYNLSNPFELSSASLTKQENSEAGQPTGFVIKGDGTKMYEIGKVPDVIYQYDVSTPYEIDSFFVEKEFTVSLNNPEGMAFSTDGTKIFVTGSAKIQEYDLGNPFDVGSANFNIEISTSDSSPKGIAFDTSGSRLFIANSSFDTINEYSLNTPFDIQTATFEGRKLNMQDGFPEDLAFSDDGSKLYESGRLNEKIYQSDLQFETVTEWQSI